MAVWLSDEVLDVGLTVLGTVDRIYVCSAQPADFDEASSTFALGYADASGFGSPQAVTNGRAVSIGPLTGTTTDDGTVVWWAAVDGAAIPPLLLAAGTVDVPEDVVAGRPFDLGAWLVQEAKSVQSGAQLAFGLSGNSMYLMVL